MKKEPILKYNATIDNLETSPKWALLVIFQI